MNQAANSVMEIAHERRCIINSEVYPLAPPKLYQEVSGSSVQATEMVANDVFMTVTPNARIWFNGVGTVILDQNDEIVFRFGAPGPARFNDESMKQHLSGRAMVLGTIGAHCYYHWMVDVLPRLGVVRRAGYEWSSIDHFLVRDFDLGFQKATLAELGIPASKILCTKDQPAYTADELLHVELRNFVGMRMHGFVPEFLRSVFLKTKDASRSQGRRIFITRPAGVNRAVINEQDLLYEIQKTGLENVTMEGMTLAEQADLFYSADVIVTTHGGALTNLVYCRPGTKVIELFGEHVFSYYYGLANLCGLDYTAILKGPEQIDLVIDPTVGNQMRNQACTIRQDSCIALSPLREALRELL